MPLVIPIFIPHQGCPHQCLFCNQHAITGEPEEPVDVASQVPVIIDEWLARSRRGQDEQVQVAFFGGSFTCLPENRQRELLAAVQPFLRTQGRAEGQPPRVDCIRLSTRPDCVYRETPGFLRMHGVRVVELGVQSLDDKVLRAAWRGHDAGHCRQAVALLAEAGMEVGIQLMPGLPQETTASFLRTVREVAALNPAFVRLYPALVVEHSGLAALYRQGGYRPLSLNRAIALSCRAKEIFEEAAIPVVRIGLQPSASLERDLLAGPYHPAFGELVAARIWLKKIRPLLATCPGNRRLKLRISPRDLSGVVGMKRANMRRFEQLGLLERLEIITEPSLPRGTLEYAVN